jgi:type IV secretory pathway VirB10-like protein
MATSIVEQKITVVQRFCKTGNKGLSSDRCATTAHTLPLAILEGALAQKRARAFGAASACNRSCNGQSRVLLVWTRLIMPNGRSIILERQPGADTGGYAGLQDEVDHHWGALFKAGLLSTLLSVGAELGSGAGNSNGDSSVLQALRRGAGDSLNQTGQQVVRRNLNMQPTLTIRPGFPVRVIVNRDLVLEPYRM